jgi:hypothetical protein
LQRHRGIARIEKTIQRGAVAFQKLLPNVKPGSDLAAGVKAFLKEYSSPDRPAH